MLPEAGSIPIIDGLDFFSMYPARSIYSAPSKLSLDEYCEQGQLSILVIDDAGCHEVTFCQ